MDTDDLKSKEAEHSADELLKLIQDQSKEIKVNKKKLEKLEERFIKLNSDFKLCNSDRACLEDFLKSIFPKELVNSVVKAELGSYEKSELGRMWVIYESQRENEIQKHMARNKVEIGSLSERNGALRHEVTLLKQMVQESEAKLKDSIFLENSLSQVNSKLETIEEEKSLLLSLLEDKDKTIARLSNFEIEVAEIKAKTLLDSRRAKPTVKQIVEMVPESNGQTSQKKISISITKIVFRLECKQLSLSILRRV